MIGPIETFKTEAKEHLASLEVALLELENEPTNIEFIDQAFRAMHTIKGAGGMFGYDELTEFTHHLESVFEQTRTGEVTINADFISLMLDARDHLSTLLDDTSFTTGQKVLSAQLLVRLYKLIPEKTGNANTLSSPLPEKIAEASTQVYRVLFTPDGSSFRNGFDVVPILRELASFGEIVVTTKTEKLPAFKELIAEECFLSWDVCLVTEQPKSTIEDTFMFVVDDWKIMVEQIDLHDTDDDSDRLGELLVSRGVLTRSQLNQVLNKRTEIGQILTQEGLVSKEDINAALAEQQKTRQLKNPIKKQGIDSNIRVPASRLDSLMNLVGELVIVQARLNQIANQHDSEDIIGIAEELDLLTTQMRDETFNIRMLPIGATFGRFRRLVRDLSTELDKKIQLVTIGAETELDKMVLDKLGDPLVHLIRNSIDHGIEDYQTRLQIGKPESGTITLSAEHADSQIIIRIVDDGGGLSTDLIRLKALEKKLIQEDDQLSENDIHMLIFEAGFSTAEQVSDISGRGVGMDVVKRSIQELGGKISIESKQNVGTTIIIKLPMTLAIIEGLMVRVGKEHYILPLNAVEECIELFSEQQKVTNKRLVTLRGKQIPYLSLREWFCVGSNQPSIQQVVITKIDEEYFGFCVDEVVGQYQTVIKRLGKLYEGVVGFSGATILGDGSIAMILNTQALMDSVTDNK